MVSNTAATRARPRASADKRFVAAAIRMVCIAASSARLTHDIDERRLAACDDRYRFAQHGRELRRILDRPRGPHTHALRERRVVDERVLERRADLRTPVDAAAAARGHALHVHELLVIRAVV